MLIIDQSRVGVFYGADSLLQAISYYFGELTLSVYISIKQNKGITSKSLSIITKKYPRKVEEALTRLWHADLIYNSFESGLESEIEKKHGQVPRFFNKVKQKIDISEWELFEWYKVLEERSPMKKKLFNLLSFEDPKNEKCWYKQLPINVTSKNLEKTKQTRAVRYFVKPFNAIGFPIRHMESRADVYEWIAKVADPTEKTHVIAKSRRFGEKRTSRVVDELLGKEIYTSEIIRILEEMGLGRNKEVLAHWLWVMSPRMSSGMTTREYVMRRCEDLRQYFPIEKKMPFADMKIYYILCEGYSKYDFYSTI